jgi:glycosyltransferase involved in cell wall biosynthesis
MGYGNGLVVIETHPVQYHAPVYRALQRDHGIPVTAVYGSDFSVAGYRDPEFGARFAWDTDLLSGYRSHFLARTADGGAKTAEAVSARGLGRVLRGLDPAAVLLVGYGPRFCRRSFWQAWRGRYPLLFRAETTDHARHRSPLKRWLRDRLLRWLYRRFAALLYVGRRSLEHYRRLGCPEQRLVFSPYCVDVAALRPGEAGRAELRRPTRQELGLADDQLAVLFSGKLVPRKGPDLLLRAIKQLPAEQRQRAVVLFLGDGELREPLQQLAAAEPGVQVRFLGFQNQRALSRFYHAADLLVLPSRCQETWGLVVNEALHHGLPCVVSDAVGCAPDLVEAGRTGEVFAADTEPALTEALMRAAALTGRPEVRDACRSRVASYTVEAAAAGIAQAYRTVTRQRISA